MKSFTFIDLFAGIGGFHHALSRIGGRCVMACELDAECRGVYRSSFPTATRACFPKNIRELTRKDVDEECSIRSAREIDRIIPDHDMLCAGFPCQPFSKSGVQLGVQDRTRGTLFFDIMQVVRAKRPRYLLLENVRNLAGPRHTQTWRLIIENLRDAGYCVSDAPSILSPHLLPPNCGGTPQARERVFILAEQRGGSTSTYERSVPPVDRMPVVRWNPANWRIEQYLEPDSEIIDIQRYRLKRAELSWLEAWDAFVRGLPSDSLPSFPIWADAFRRRPIIPEGAPDWEADFLRKNAHFYSAHQGFIDSWLRKSWGDLGLTLRDFPASRRKFEWQARSWHPIRKGRTIRDLVLQMRPSGIRVKSPTYLPALVAITQCSIVGPEVGRVSEYRTLTPREGAKLQGVPEDIFEKAGVSDRVAYKQLGNAVNVGVVRWAAHSLFCRSVSKASANNGISRRLKISNKFV
ncbi:MAG: DNA (cytosine-5-)-methyltransferase [Planctomycetes bacterium]|nr:DNA (cytosine-5-)-methyltransferase [Planctomycetota bacterium]